MALTEFLWHLLIGSATVFVMILAGRSLHEIAHYRVVQYYGGEPDILFERLLIPERVHYDPDNLSKRPEQLAAIAPTPLYAPLLVLFVATSGIPTLPITKLFFVHFGFLGMLTVAMFPSPGDIGAFQSATK